MANDKEPYAPGDSNPDFQIPCREGDPGVPVKK